MVINTDRPQPLILHIGCEAAELNPPVARGLRRVGIRSLGCDPAVGVADHVE